ncbi:hypothetical protein MJO28_007558 [Puccinia striiformis f. sp. tritici]|uniref:chitin synthase n=3 Tax=Puccinia striiformis TaxID=27350 RepID=A0A0L0UQ69_9BASI|nr:hypothetical protein Pst134EB_014631 [Puccinia striiformis f. sp. tritici]KAI7951874.1 hypothetical protein MJO28_007558 [Puccinia striiformis f. sp. tritici]KAI7956103.1 hypothetical protein MJO29_007502 [Puccinia striiformis f. sp. tritici]KNE89232.1 hypothetical protein PSTG_17311 [Puccinia striiformis f. sp. tritici PST-78]POW00904.1 hypothetical protein PSTT_12816 [Puccinia striiformis]
MNHNSNNQHQLLRQHSPSNSPTIEYHHHQQQQGSAGTTRRALTRGKTLTRPERYVTPAPLITQNQPGFSSTSTAEGGTPWYSPWPLYVRLVTLPIPSFFLSTIGISDKHAQEAWREKVALCSIALIAALFTGFVTVGMNRALCPIVESNTTGVMIPFDSKSDILGIHGWAFNTSQSKPNGPVNFQQISSAHSGLDISTIFDQSQLSNTPICQDQQSLAFAHSNLCYDPFTKSNACLLPKLEQSTLDQLQLLNQSVPIGYTWDQVAHLDGYIVINGIVLNLLPYLSSNAQPIEGDPVDRAIRHMLQSNLTSMGKDATRLFTYSNDLHSSIPCLISRFRAGSIDKITPGCFISQLFLYVSLIVILGVVLVRFSMAIFFSWFLSDRLIKPPRNLRRKVISPAVLPEGANLSITNKNGAAPWASPSLPPPSNSPTKALHHQFNPLSEKSGLLLDPNSASTNPKTRQQQLAQQKHQQQKVLDSNGLINMAAIGAELFCICLVTCYSEGAEGIKKTLDSISNADYSDARKLLIVVCDGMITGHGEKISTPDVCVGFLDADPLFGDPMPMSYRAVAAGQKEHNQAMVYAGHYTQVEGRRTPMIVVVKCGTIEEGRREKKPGNRGKRDSQMILMNFFSRVTYNDRMSPLDYDLFRKIQALMGVTADFFEVCLMVDADTIIYKDSIRHLVNCMQHDPLIMGVCGETRITNKRQSWVTAIQVFEYYISHHLAKAFESVFGGVTCLPGCFSMYRLKARRLNDGDWVPILSQPEICREYSQSIVTTLHQKNLLLLGEDRFLTTLMIRTFPARKMMFCPQAKCRTLVPDEFAVLVSQRRRWINSTIHNLMELVRVPNLCGTFCFSMQFVVFMELMGTVVLPIAITLTYSLIINSILHPPKNFSDAIPLILLAAILGLPAILILATSRKISYVFWMLIYLIALPVWNFVLPLYAFWHFDDFSWGETRKVEGEAKSQSHDTGALSTFDPNTIPHRRWEDWERSRLKKVKREERRRREFERTFGTQQYHLSTMGGSEYGGGDTVSMISSEDDRWGLAIGNYDSTEVARPPVGLYTVDDNFSSVDGSSVVGGGAAVQSSTTLVNGDELGLILEQGWTDNDDHLYHPHHHYHHHPPVHHHHQQHQQEFIEPKYPSPSRQNLIPTTTRLHSPVGFNLDPNTQLQNHQPPFGYHPHHHSQQQHQQSSSNDNSRSHSPVNGREPRPPQRYRLEDS